MSENYINLDRLSHRDTVSVAIALLYSVKNIPAYSVASELPYLVDYESFIKIIQYYGGMTIRIPTTEELDHIMKVLLLYQKSRVQKLEWKDALAAAGFKEEESLSARNLLVNFEKLLKEQEIGGRNYE